MDYAVPMTGRFSMHGITALQSFRRIRIFESVWLDVGNAGTESIVGLLRKERERIERFAASEESPFLILSLGAKAV
jgi:hypothetical protein